jgi:hypothetical protein
VTNTCPVFEEAEKALELGNKFNRQLRRLRQSTKLCEQCASKGECQLLSTLNQQISNAITEVVEEWALRL